VHDELRNLINYRVRAALSSHYYGSQHGWQRWIRQRRFHNSMLALPKRFPELAELLDKGMLLSKRDPNRPNSRHSDALFLIDLITELKPRRVLECGAGLSTLIIAYALEQIEKASGHKSEFISLDESTEYIEKMVLPTLPARLAQRTALKASTPAYWHFENMRTLESAGGIGYTDRPKQHFDLIYVDGPQVRQGQFRGLVRDKSVSGVPPFLDRPPFDCDALNVVIESQKLVTVVIDQRIDTRWQMKTLLDRPYEDRYYFAPRKSVFRITPAAVQFVRSVQIDPSLYRAA
jgi:hypothetical protein